MALELIFRGKLKINILDGLYLDSGDFRFYLSDELPKYLGKTLVISLEEEEEELGPIVSARLKRLFAPA